MNIDKHFMEIYRHEWKHPENNTWHELIIFGEYLTGEIYNSFFCEKVYIENNGISIGKDINCCLTDRGATEEDLFDEMLEEIEADVLELFDHIDSLDEKMEELEE